jgi:hypothetical protein
MSFSVRLTEDLVSLEAGATTPLGFEVANRSDEPDRYEVEIEGLDPEWTAIPVPSFSVDPRDLQTEKIFLKPPRASESLAGNYPFVLKVRSLISGEDRKVQAILQIKPFHHVSIEIMPKKGFVSPTRKQNSFGVTLMNLGNTEHTLQLYGNDPEEACTFEFEQEQVTVGPGQQKEVEVIVAPASSRLISSGRLHGLTVAGRSVEIPSVMATSQAQLEQRAFLSPVSLIALAMFAIVVAFWIYMLPKPPTIELAVDPAVIVTGQPIQIAWRAANATDVTIMAGEEVLVTGGGRMTGTHAYTPQFPGILTIQAVASRDGRQSPPQRMQVDVRAPEVAPDPQILTFRTEPEKVGVNQPFLLVYQFNTAVVRAILSPTNQELDLNTDRIELTRNVPGEMSYTIVALNRDGKSVRQSVKVTVEDRPDAQIISFRASPTTVDPLNNRFAFTWQVHNAVALELTYEDQTITVEAPRGSIDLAVNQTRTFTLIAYDAQKRSVRESIKIVYQEPPIEGPPPPDGFPPLGPPGSTGGPR